MSTTTPLVQETVQAPRDAQKVISQLSAMAMMDEAFKDRLVAHPASVLSEHGLEIPPDVRIEIMKSFEEVPTDRDPHTIYLVIPRGDELMQEDLSMTIFAAQSCQSTASSVCSIPSSVSSASTTSSNSCQ